MQRLGVLRRAARDRELRRTRHCRDSAEANRIRLGTNPQPTLPLIQRGFNAPLLADLPLWVVAFVRITEVDLAANYRSDTSFSIYSE